MFKYEKMLEYPVNVKKKDLRMAKLLVAQWQNNLLHKLVEVMVNLGHH